MTAWDTDDPPVPPSWMSAFRRASVIAVFIAAGVVLVVVAAVARVTAPSRDERADRAARAACRVFREPFDGTNRKMDALPTDERIAARHRQLVATTDTAATAARLSPRWAVLYENWRRLVDEPDDPEPTQVLLGECRKALSGGRRSQHDIDCDVARTENRYVEGCPLA